LHGHALAYYLTERDSDVRRQEESERGPIASITWTRSVTGADRLGVNGLLWTGDFVWNDITEQAGYFVIKEIISVR